MSSDQIGTEPFGGRKGQSGLNPSILHGIDAGAGCSRSHPRCGTAAGMIAGVQTEPQQPDA